MMPGMTTLDTAIRARLAEYDSHECQVGAWCYVTGFEEMREALLAVLDAGDPDVVATIAEKLGIRA